MLYDLLCVCYQKNYVSEKLEDLQYNLTQAFHLKESCDASWAAAINHQRATESLYNALNTSHMSLQNQL